MRCIADVSESFTVLILKVTLPSEPIVHMRDGLAAGVVKW